MVQNSDRAVRGDAQSSGLGSGSFDSGSLVIPMTGSGRVEDHSLFASRLRIKTPMSAATAPGCQTPGRSARCRRRRGRYPFTPR